MAKILGNETVGASKASSAYFGSSLVRLRDIRITSSTNFLIGGTNAAHVGVPLQQHVQFS